MLGIMLKITLNYMWHLRIKGEGEDGDGGVWFIWFWWAPQSGHVCHLESSTSHLYSVSSLIDHQKFVMDGLLFSLSIDPTAVLLSSLGLAGLPTLRGFVPVF